MKKNKSIQLIGRLLISIIILSITAFFTPGFERSNYITIIIAILSLSFFDFFIGNYTRLFYHPYLKFFIGFVLSSLTLYLVQSSIIGYVLSIVPIILGGIVYGLVDFMLPNEKMNNRVESGIA